MAGQASNHPLVLGARSVLRPISEFIQTAAIYLGIAVLVTLVLSITVPSLRAQSQHLHAALLAALQPAALVDDNMLDPLARDPDSWFAAGTGPLQGDPSSPAYFTHALSVAGEQWSIPGVTREQAGALRSYIARKYRIAASVAGVLIKTTFIVGREKGLDPQLLLAVIAIESRYNPFAESHVGAQGLMQVMTRVHKKKFDQFADGTVAALNPVANIRVGSQILHDCIERRGSIEKGLACYVGAVGPGDGGYGRKVLAERRRIALASGIPVGTGESATADRSG